MTEQKNDITEKKQQEETEIDLMREGVQDRKGNEEIILTEGEVLLRPDLSEAQIRELEEVPAYERRDLRIN